MQQAIRTVVHAIDECFSSFPLTEIASFLSSDSRFLMVSDYSIGTKAGIAFSFSFIPYSKLKNLVSEIGDKAPVDLKNTRHVGPMIEFLTGNDVVNFCIASTEKTFFKTILGHARVLKAFELQRSELLSLNKTSFFDLDGVVRRNLETIQKLRQKNANYPLVKKLVFTATFAGYFASKISELSKAKEIVWFSDRDNMTSYCGGLVYDLYRLNCYTMPFRSENTVFKFINEEPDDRSDHAIRIADFTAGAIADFDFENDKFTMEKHEQIARSLIESSNSFLFKLDHVVDRVSVGKMTYVS